MSSRTLSAYERNQLLRHGFNPEDIDSFDEMPVEYITGWVTFYGREFQVSPSVLIPRIETEELVSLILNSMTTRTTVHTLKIADIGTGSGAIGITLALEMAERYQAHWYLSDISAEALHIAQMNYARLKPTQPLHFIESNLLSDYPPNTQFDLIIANLPYIPETSITTLDPSVRDYEPWLALDGGVLGVELIQKLLNQAERYLTENGEIWLEIDESHTPALLDPQERFEIQIYTDSFGKNRFARLRQK